MWRPWLIAKQKILFLVWSPHDAPDRRLQVLFHWTIYLLVLTIFIGSSRKSFLLLLELVEFSVGGGTISQLNNHSSLYHRYSIRNSLAGTTADYGTPVNFLVSCSLLFVLFCFSFNFGTIPGDLNIKLSFIYLDNSEFLESGFGTWTISRWPHQRFVRVFLVFFGFFFSFAIKNNYLKK